MSGGHSGWWLRPRSSRFAAALVLGAVVAFATTMRTPLLGDDWELILHSSQQPSGLGWLVEAGANGRYRPLLWLTLGANHAIGGVAPVGYHLVNVLLHAAAAWLVALVIESLLLLGGHGAGSGDGDGDRHRDVEADVAVAGDGFHRSWLPAVGAVWFLLSPTHAEAVIWVAARADLLLAGAGLLCTYAWIRWRADGGWWAACSLGAFAAALLAKETAIVLPLVIVSFELWLPAADGRRPTLRRSAAWLTAMGGLSVAYLVLYRSVNGGSLGEEGALVAGESPVLFARRAVQLAARSVFPSLPRAGLVIMAILVVACLVATALLLRSPAAQVRLRTRAGAIGFSLTATVATIGPVGRLGASLTSPAGGRLAYFSSAFATIALVLVASAVLPRVRSSALAAGLALAVVAVLFGFLVAESRPYREGGLLARTVVDQMAGWDDAEVPVLLASPDTLEGVFVGRNGLGPAGQLTRPGRTPTWLTEVAAVDLVDPKGTISVRRGACARCVMLRLDDPAARFTSPSERALPFRVSEAGATVTAIDDREVEVRLDPGVDVARYWYTSGGRLVPLGELPD